MQEEYPLKDCYECMHRYVCKWTSYFTKMAKSGVPLDFPNVSCKECTISLEDDVTAAEEIGNVQNVDFSNLKDALNLQLLNNHSVGLVSRAITMSRDTLNQLMDYLDVCGNDPYMVATAVGIIDVVFSESLPLGVFYIINNKIGGM